MIALRIVISGLVQGVGFRPYVDTLAKSLGLRGYVRNVGGAEVEILIEGEADKILLFLHRLLTKVPEPAEIEHVVIERSEPTGRADFNIERSSEVLQLRSMVPPDFSICDECLREVLDPNDRRYRYPFNSCVWCGPRFSMMYEVPYDRDKTSMRSFPPCSDCLREYRDPQNRRRYHAQGVSCPSCGPRVNLYTRTWELVDVKDPIKEAAKLVNEGYLVGVKGIGGYHIASLATDDEVVLKLRARKKRPSKPFAVMALDLTVVDDLVVLDNTARKLLTSPQKPIVLLPKKEGSPASTYVSPGMSHEGVFLPYTALHYLLLRDVKDRFAVMTSGNVTDEPMCHEEGCARVKLSKIVDYFLVHDREIVNRVDDSVIRFTDGTPVLLRRARGYAPRWVRIPLRLSRDVVAMGADLHNAPAVAFEDKVVLTQYIGELSNGDTIAELLRYVKYFSKVYRVDLGKVTFIVDKHPRYISRMVGLDMGRKSGQVLEVQHHVAHVLSTMADNSLVGEAYIGVAADGVGYGDDGAVWGCELMLVSRRGYERLGRLAYVKLSGSDRDAEYPARALASYLSRFMSLDEIELFYEKRGLFKALPGGRLELEVFLSNLKRNWVLSSSLGRLLDSISVMLGIASYREYEGSPAIRLEEASSGGSLLTDDLADSMVRPGELIEIDPNPLFLKVLELLENGKDVRDVAYTAQFAIGQALGKAIVLAAKGRRVSRLVPVGGGAVVNTVIVQGMRSEVNKEGYVLVFPTAVPPNDGGIALGQVYSSVYMECRQVGDHAIT